MEINIDTGDIITLDAAINYTHDFQEIYSENDKSYFAGKNKINYILAQKDCIGIRIYNGFNKVLKRANLVLIGVNSTGGDMTDGIIIQDLFPCPKGCPASSPLMKL